MLLCMALAGASSVRPRRQALNHCGPNPLKLAGSASDGLEFVPATGSRPNCKAAHRSAHGRARSTDILARVVLNVDEDAIDALFDQIQKGAPIPTLKLASRFGRTRMSRARDFISRRQRGDGSRHAAHRRPARSHRLNMFIKASTVRQCDATHRATRRA